MAASVKLFTQSELNDLNAQLDLIQKNMNAHVNSNLSKAHSVKAISGTYKDSGGDTVGDLVLEFQFGDPPAQTTIYVPARIVSGSTDPGPRDVGDGIAHAATSPTGTSTSPGVPINQKSLVTTSPAALSLNQSTVYNELLLLHSITSINDIRELQCHGGLTFSSDDILDTLGHIVGRNTVNIGYNGVLYKLPGDQTITGPPQTVRGLLCATSLGTSPKRNRSHHAHDDDGVGYVYLDTFFTDTPSTVVWQSNEAGGYGVPGAGGNYTISDVWFDLNPTGQGGISGPLQGGVPGNFSINATNTRVRVTFGNGSDDSRVKQFIRVKATNAGGTVYSNVCVCSGNDEDGGWFSGPDSSYWTAYDGRLPNATILI
jgi:hypothetical protein